MAPTYYVAWPWDSRVWRQTLLYQLPFWVLNNGICYRRVETSLGHFVYEPT